MSLEESFEKDYYGIASSYLPVRIRAAVDAARRERGAVDEIRLICGARASVVTVDGTVTTDVVCREDELRRTVMSLCGNSVYSHSETIREGYVVTSDGIRAGVAGRAVCEGGRIVAVTDVGGLVIRIPSRRPGFADELYGIMERYDFLQNVLVFSAPSGGKTTLLRELAALLSVKKRVAAVDTRCEITEGLSGYPILTLYGYPRAKGTEIAVRTMSPEIVVCDEISTEEDLDAVGAAAGAGVTVVASCHSDGALSGRTFSRCRESGLFPLLYGVEKSGRGKLIAAGAKDD